MQLLSAILVAVAATGAVADIPATALKIRRRLVSTMDLTFTLAGATTGLPVTADARPMASTPTV
ncbi:hypothetical protein E4U52_003196 [Claviceps spartinae]|nr:hypothetical protein E4U52_003196 [Claviceps spartinae]